MKTVAYFLWQFVFKRWDIRNNKKVGENQFGCVTQWQLAELLTNLARSTSCFIKFSFSFSNDAAASPSRTTSRLNLVMPSLFSEERCCTVDL